MLSLAEKNTSSTPWGLILITQLVGIAGLSPCWGKSVSEDGQTVIYGYQATGHLIQVEQVLKGSPGTGNVRILSMPQTCTGGKSYPDGDPLQTSERVIIFATQQGRDWVTMTYRVVDLNGKRAVIGVTYFHESINPELTREARAVFDSIVFRTDK